MERRYLGIQAHGNPRDILNKVVAGVRSFDLHSTVPLVKFEKNPKRQFYLFFAVDGADGDDIPTDVISFQRAIGLSGQEYWPLAPEEIKSMTQNGVDLHSFIQIPRLPLPEYDPGDPLDHSDAPWPPAEGRPELSPQFERLLYWASALGGGTFQAFIQACQALQVAGGPTDARSVFRRLRLLGHIESSGDGQRWSAAPAAFVRFPGHPADGFLAGRRTPALLQGLGDEVISAPSPQPGHQGPPRLELAAGRWPEYPGGPDDAAVSDAGIASTRLAELLPDLAGWQASLAVMPKLPLASFEMERWQEGGFQSCEPVYERDGWYYGASGMYRLSRPDRGRANPYTLTLFFDEPGQRWLRGDWYGLRFLAAAGPSAAPPPALEEAVHLSGEAALLLPAAQRWPLLYERALTLASGLLPGPAPNRQWLQYPGIPLELAQTLCRKLGVPLRPSP